MGGAGAGIHPGIATAAAHAGEVDAGGVHPVAGNNERKGFVELGCRRCQLIGRHGFGCVVRRHYNKTLRGATAGNAFRKGALPDQFGNAVFQNGCAPIFHRLIAVQVHNKRMPGGPTGVILRQRLVIPIDKAARVHVVIDPGKLCITKLGKKGGRDEKAKS